MFYLVFGLIFVLLIIGSVLAAKHWHWSNSVFVVLFYLASLAAVVGMANVHFYRTKLVGKFQETQKNVKLEQEKLDKAIAGEPDDVGFGAGSLRAVSNELDLELLGRGRVWSGGTVAAPAGKQWNFRFPNALADVSEDQLEVLTEIEVHVFRDGIVAAQLYENGLRAPVHYIGKFRITTATAEGFVLTDVLLLDPEEAANPTSTWTVFEKMPLDRRGVFREAVKVLAKREGQDLTIGQIRQFLVRDFLPADRLRMNPESADYERFIDNYAFDGQPINVIEQWIIDNSENRLSGEFQPRPDEVHIRYEFLEDSANSYIVDADENIQDEGAFTGLGHATARELHVGGPVTFKKGDIVSIVQATADGYKREDGTNVAPFTTREKVQELERVFKRKYRDFPFLFEQYGQAIAKQQETLQGRSEDNSLYDNSIAKAVENQISERSRYRGDLETDNSNAQNDLKAINDLIQRRMDQLAALQQRSTAAKQKQQQLRTELDKKAKIISTASIQARQSGRSDEQQQPYVEASATDLLGRDRGF